MIRKKIIKSDSEQSKRKIWNGTIKTESRIQNHQNEKLEIKPSKRKVGNETFITKKLEMEPSKRKVGSRTIKTESWIQNHPCKKSVLEPTYEMSDLEPQNRVGNSLFQSFDLRSFALVFL